MFAYNSRQLHLVVCFVLPFTCLVRAALSHSYFAVVSEHGVSESTPCLDL